MQSRVRFILLPFTLGRARAAPRVFAHMTVKLLLTGSRRFVRTSLPSANRIWRLGAALRAEACTVTFAGEKQLRLLEPYLDRLTLFSYLECFIASQGQA